jgi:hypothetical protein
MQSWLASSLVRHYPASPARRCDSLRLEAARGEQVSFQIAFRTEGEVRDVTAVVESPDSLGVQVRRVGCVPVPHHNTETSPEELDGFGLVPGLVPDPLFPDGTVKAGPYETNAFWLTVRVPAEAKPGPHRISVTLTAEGEDPATLGAEVVVHPAAIEPRRDFPATQWFYADALCDRYGVEPFEDAFWPIVERYLANLAAHNIDTSHVPIFTPPTDGVKRPNQLLNVRRDSARYSFDWKLVRKWTEVARRQGLSRLEWVHLFTQWGAKYAIRVYEGNGRGEKLLWDPETPGLSPTYRDFLAQFLPEFKRFLDDENLLDCSLFHLSDEPHGEEPLRNYRAARAMLRELAPWMRVMDALSDITFAREGLTDMPIALVAEAPSFAREGYDHWVYFWAGPRGRYAQRLLDTPLVKTRMLGWLFYANKACGFLHWSYNYWYKTQTRELIDPYSINDALAWPNWAHGDPFMVYPGENGPIDSLRWEVFAESLQDYALLQTAGLDPDDPSLADIESYADFPREEAWILDRRRRLWERRRDAVSPRRSRPGR